MRKAQLTQKDMQALHETERTKVQQQRSNGNLKDYSLQHRVFIEWDLNDDAKQEQMCRLTIGDNSAIIDIEELMRYLRWV